MIRIVSAFLISILILAFIFSYIGFVESIELPSISVEETSAEKQYSVAIQFSADTVVDEFDLNPVSVRIKFKEKVLFESSSPVKQSQLIRINNIDGLKFGKNELFISAKLKGVESEGGSEFETGIDQFSLNSDESESSQSTESAFPQTELREITEYFGTAKVLIYEGESVIPFSEVYLKSNESGNINDVVTIVIGESSSGKDETHDH